VVKGLVTIASGLTAPSQIAVDCQSVYWISGGAGTLVMKAPIGGGTPTTLASGQDGQSGISIDSTSVYWTAAGMLRKVPIAGGVVTTLVPDTPTDGGGPLLPQEVVVHDDYVYFIDEDTTDQLNLQNLLMRVPSGGGAPSTLVPEGQGLQGAALGAPFAVDDSFVYWVGNFGNGEAMKTPIGGGAAITLGPGPGGNLAVDSKFLYWVSGSVGKIPLAGGASTTLAGNVTGPQEQTAGPGIAVDSSFVYWTNESGGTVEKVPLNGGAVITLASDQGFPSGLAIDDHSVYWANTAGTIMQLTPK
jgi:hypothetical protein